MIEDNSPERIANAILMDVAYPGSYLVVEGERDFLFFNKFIEKKECRIRTAFASPRLFRSLKF
jgi:hypothetical protein